MRQNPHVRICGGPGSATTLVYPTMLDDSHWPATSALIDEACDLTGNALMVGEGPQDDIRVTFVGLYYRGQRRPDLEREYLDVYHPINEGIPRLRQLPDGHLVPIKDLYTAEELHTSRAYNEALRRGQYQQGLNRAPGRAGGLPHDLVARGIPSPRKAGGRRRSRWSGGSRPTSDNSSASGKRWSAPRLGTRP